MYDYTKNYGKVIKNIELVDNKLLLEMEDGARFKIWDDGQNCCERRYMETDDNLSSLIGGTLKSINIKDGDTNFNHSKYDIKESEFLEIQTTEGFVIVANYNEHNGYYEGFEIKFAECL